MAESANPPLLARRNRKGAPWTLKDLIAAAAILSRAFSISSAPLLPISPIVFFSFLFLTICLNDLKRFWATLWRTPAVLPYLTLITIQLVGTLASSELDYATISKVGQVASAGAFMLALAAYMLARPEVRLRRYLLLSLWAMGLSALWFILEITITEPFVGLRLRLYADSYLRFDWADEGDFTRSGLCPFLHILGYQLSFLVPVLLVMESRHLSKITNVFRVLGVLLGGVAIYFSSQRSVFFASAFTLLLFMYYSAGRRLTGRILGLVVFILALLMVTTSLEVWDTDFLQASITDKLLDTRHWNEALFRLQLQWQALKIIVSHPLGLSEPAEEWVELGFWPVYESSASPPFNTPIAVHNGYLGQSLQFGVILLLVALLFLKGILRLTHQNLEKRDSGILADSSFTRAVAAATPGLFLLQSSTHNASIITEDASCLILFALLVVIDILRREELIRSHSLRSAG